MSLLRLKTTFILIVFIDLILNYFSRLEEINIKHKKKKHVLKPSAKLLEAYKYIFDSFLGIGGLRIWKIL